MEFIPQFLLPLPDALQVEVEEDRQQGEEEGEEGGESKSETHCESQSTLHCTLCTVTELTQLLSLPPPATTKADKIQNTILENFPSY